MCAAPLTADARKMIEKIALDRAAKLGGDAEWTGEQLTESEVRDE